MQLIFCDESCHLEHDDSNYMLLGGIRCPKGKKEKIYNDIKKIKEKHGLSEHFEIKWIKVSKAKIEFYEEIIDYFFNENYLSFRTVIASKRNLVFGYYSKNDDFASWYYKMYYLLLYGFISINKRYRIFIDIKDSRGGERISLLKEIIHKKLKTKVINDINQIHSHTSEILQITDLLIGALGYYKRELNTSEAKLRLVKKILTRTRELNLDISKSTPLKEKKFNVFYWEGQAR